MWRVLFAAAKRVSSPQLQLARPANLRYPMSCDLSALRPLEPLISLSTGLSAFPQANHNPCHLPSPCLSCLLAQLACGDSVSWLDLPHHFHSSHFLNSDSTLIPPPHFNFTPRTSTVALLHRCSSSAELLATRPEWRPYNVWLVEGSVFIRHHRSGSPWRGSASFQLELLLAASRLPRNEISRLESAQRHQLPLRNQKNHRLLHYPSRFKLESRSLPWRLRKQRIYQRKSINPWARGRREIFEHDLMS